jgi:hypothetical protein
MTRKTNRPPPPPSASTATIIRFPFVNGLTDTADFLYATTDVAIWSLVESGLGITASSAATLRPLFRTFLSRSRLFGPSTRDEYPSGGWSNNPSRGYSRRTGNGDINLRSDLAKGSITTTVVGGRDHEHDIEMGAHGRRVNGNDMDAHIKEPWDGSQTKLNDASSVGSEDVAYGADWRNGFRTTTVTVESTPRGVSG